ncbi:TetR/AcrR family transcriptional regulator [Spongiibacter tropicus]|uniref:TetR/AcrR family transcriptional regulator n=1 Tax=Spongiibacter tropicus TaxID=454602 RepID=UPI0035BE10DA
MPESAPQRRRSYRGQSSDARRAERRQLLLEAALNLIAEQGYSNATVRNLCAAAGLTERYFYESFSNREALLGELYQQQTEILREAMLSAIHRSNGGAEQAVRAGLQAFFETLQNCPSLARVILFEIFGVSKTMDALYYQAMEDFAALLGELAQVLGIARIVPPASDAMLYAGLVGAAVQMARRWVLNDYHESPDILVESSLLLFMALSEQQDAPLSIEH